MSRSVLAFVPQHTSTKSRVMAIVDKGRGHEIDAVATVDWPHEAVALCNILNSPEDGREVLSDLWAALPSSIRASLEQARDQQIGKEDERYGLAELFITSLEVPELPAPNPNTRWAELYPAAGCPDGGCNRCVGCPEHARARGEDVGVNRCGPGGSCGCVTAELGDDDEPCACSVAAIGPRWVAAIYQSLAETAEALADHAEGLMWGVQGPLVGLPESLGVQSPQFYLRLAQACTALCDEFVGGRVPVPHTIAELLMLDEAARFYVEAFVGKEGLDLDAMKEEWAHLPEVPGDFDLDALRMLHLTDSDWIDIAESDERFAPGSIDHIFETLPEAADWPRTRS